MLGVDHSTICAIAQACSGITHLELHLKSAKKADVKALANLHELQWIRTHFWITVPNEGGPATNMYDEDSLDTNGSEDGSEDENSHASDYDIACGQATLLFRVFRNHVDLVVAREQDPDSEYFDETQIELSKEFSLCIVHQEGKRLTVQT
ncbi:hypothetical protein B0H14DRAFT_2883510 [Mycena olivaceomarginata]|nr:hypothetical protein B0H14DRAFT_2883510 [Mycena olivaceomarginata]